MLSLRLLLHWETEFVNLPEQLEDINAMHFQLGLFLSCAVRKDSSVKFVAVRRSFIHLKLFPQYRYIFNA